MAISNIVFLASSALGGLWIPIMIFPQSMQYFANFLPTFHLSEIALHVLSETSERDIQYNLFIIVIMSVVLLAATIFAWTKQGKR